MSFFLEVSIERGLDNPGSGRSGRGRGGTGSNRRGGGGRGGNYPRNQHHQQGQYQSGGGRGVGKGWVPTQTGDQQRGNRLGQRGKGSGAYRPHQHGGQGVGPTRVESSEGCVVGGGGGGAGGGRGVWTGRPWGPTFVPGQSQPRSLPDPVIPNIQSLEISEQKPQSTLLDALQEISLLAAKVLVTKLISSLKPNV